MSEPVPPPPTSETPQQPLPSEPSASSEQVPPPPTEAQTAEGVPQDPAMQSEEAAQQYAQQVQQEAEALRNTLDEQAAGEPAPGEPAELDARSIFVSNVDFQTHPEELQAHFQSCGAITRVTILVNKKTQHPKGSAYIEFAERDSVQNAIKLNDTPFKGRQLKVVQKLTTVPASVFRALIRPRGGYMGRAPRRYNPYGRRPYFPRRPYF
ncbi:putative RNA recognition motif protein [Paratrimastix pyriformis]|uniref:RNA recognition motif protein n=1 Tax=Paratrimastix pyriformis TaxID=342808 RepID=A0ABQ8UX42_9EUKA|nr:putative RNA recognition motif protein [Paratrimastix pyriformis]